MKRELNQRDYKIISAILFVLILLLMICCRGSQVMKPTKEGFSSLNCLSEGFVEYPETPSGALIPNIRSGYASFEANRNSIELSAEGLNDEHFPVVYIRDLVAGETLYSGGNKALQINQKNRYAIFWVTDGKGKHKIIIKMYGLRCRTIQYPSLEDNTPQ